MIERSTSGTLAAPRAQHLNLSPTIYASLVCQRAARLVEAVEHLALGSKAQLVPGMEVRLAFLPDDDRLLAANIDVDEAVRAQVLRIDDLAGPDRIVALDLEVLGT